MIEHEEDGLVALISDFDVARQGDSIRDSRDPVWVCAIEIIDWHYYKIPNFGT
jgi:hypothetical protein